MNPKPTVLLVEDNEDDAALAEMALARSGHDHTLRVARDGQEAIEILHELQPAGVQPALVLLDLKLPRVDGRGVLRELRGDPTTVRVPVVVLTSSRLEQDVLDAYALGANSYFQKPVDFASFERDMALLLTTW
ncbi:MAG: response regulator, partial [Myxococcota bacterium]